jgi:DNA-directed RNA polymerase subunit RPC12/RpoP
VAKLVPATCPKCGANVKLDPEREIVTCQYCGASSFVQTQKRPVTEYVHAHAMPVIHVSAAAGARSGCSTALAVVAGLLALGGAVAVAVIVYLGSTAKSGVALAPVGAPPPVAIPGGSPPSSAPLIEEDYYADARLAKARYEKVLGKPIMAKQLTLMQYYATLEAQDPKNHEHVDSYRLWANAVERPQPVQLGSQKAQLSKLLFSLDEVDVGLLPKMLAQALSDLALEDGKIQVVTLYRDGPGQPPVWRVVVNGSRDNAVVEFSATGQKLRSLP